MYPDYNPLYAYIFGFVLLPLGCILLERLWPSVKGRAIFRRGFGSDVVWYFMQSLMQRSVAPLIVVSLTVLPFYQLAGLPWTQYWYGFGPLSELHIGWQAAIVYVVYDFLSYWQHRLFHRPTFWDIHAVHHSSENMDWLAATRFHPLNELAVQFICVPPIIFAGISPLAFLLLAPFTATYAILLHANLKWDFGPLRYLIASPVFHHWHHTAQEEGRDKNFAGGLPLWDLLFGTFYMSKGERPQTFGIDEALPEGFTRQLLYPLRKRAKAEPSGTES